MKEAYYRASTALRLLLNSWQYYRTNQVFLEHDLEQSHASGKIYQHHGGLNSFQDRLNHGVDAGKAVMKIRDWRANLIASKAIDGKTVFKRASPWSDLKIKRSASEKVNASIVWEKHWEESVFHIRMKDETQEIKQTEPTSQCKQ